MASTFEITVFKGRTNQRTIALKDASGTAINAQEGEDAARFKLGRRAGTTPLLDLDTIAPTAEGSRLSWTTYTPAVVTMTLSPLDMDDIEAGTYDAEILFIDDSVASPSIDPVYEASYGVVHVVGTMGGDRGIT